MGKCSDFPPHQNMFWWGNCLAYLGNFNFTQNKKESQDLSEMLN